MSDIHCAVCAEPWDAYGVFHGDMLPWESKLFRAGAGCPSCAGKASADTREAAQERHARDVLVGAAWDDPAAFAVNSDVALEAPRPPWERPADVLCWQCEECDARVMRDVDVAKPKAVTSDFGGHRWVDGLYWAPRGRDTDEQEDALLETLDAEGFGCPDEYRSHDGRALCPSCAETCHGCHERFANDDSRPLGGGYYNPDMFCEDCLSEAEVEAEGTDWTSYGARDCRKAIVEAFALSGATSDWLDEVSDDALFTLHHSQCPNDESSHDQEGTTFDFDWAESPRGLSRDGLARWIRAQRKGAA